MKTAKPGQDVRFDVPTVGPETIENLHRAGGAVLVVEAGGVLMIERETMVRLAEGYGIVIVGWPSAGSGPDLVGAGGSGG